MFRELPRQTRIGPAGGLWYKTEAFGVPVRIHKRFHKDIEAADSMAGQGVAAWPGPATTA